MARIEDFAIVLEDGIDAHSLDEELSRQPFLYYEVGLACAEAIERRDDAKDDLKRVVAEAAMEIRDREEKISEAKVTSMLDAEPRVVKAKSRLTKAIRSAHEWEALRDAFQQRSYHLKEQVALFLSAYNHDSSVDGSERDAKQARYNATRQKRRDGGSVGKQKANAKRVTRKRLANA